MTQCAGTGILDQQSDRVPQRLQCPGFGAALPVPLGKLRGGGDEPFPVAYDAGGEIGKL